MTDKTEGLWLRVSLQGLKRVTEIGVESAGFEIGVEEKCGGHQLSSISDSILLHQKGVRSS